MIFPIGTTSISSKRLTDIVFSFNFPNKLTSISIFSEELVEVWDIAITSVPNNYFIEYFSPESKVTSSGKNSILTK